MLVTFDNTDAMVADLKHRIMQVGIDNDAPVDLFVCAMADVLGIAIAKQDREAGKRTLKDRLHLFCGRVEETYQKTT